MFVDNTLHFWKYPEDESKVAPSEQISLHDCFTDLPVSLAPREVCSRLNTFMLEAQRRIQQADRDALNMHVVRILHFMCYLCFQRGSSVYSPYPPPISALTKCDHQLNYHLLYNRIANMG